MPYNDRTVDLEALDAEVFQTAADILLENGHCKSRITGPNGSHCLLGAIVSAITRFEPRPLHSRDYALVVGDVLGLPRNYGMRPGRGSRTIASVYWNNEVERTPGEVVDALITAAKFVREIQENGSD